MKTFLITFFCSMFLVGNVTLCNSKEQSNSHRLIFNCDGTDLLGNYIFKRRPLTLADVNAYIDAYAGTQVTTFMICSGSDYTIYRSKYARIFGDDRNETLDCGPDTAAYKDYISFYRNHLNLEKEGTDLISASLRRAKEKGMEAFITYRMNDLHFNDTTSRCPVEYTDFWFTHPQFWMNENIGWKSAGALDFFYQEVRDQKWNLINEQLDKYANQLDGYDLDFMRFIVYFKSADGIKNAPLMTELVKKIKAKVDELSAKRGRKILLSVRVPTDLDFCLKKGLDVKEWIRLGLLDFVTIGIHWIGNPAMPVAKFKAALGKPSIPVYATIDDGGYGARQPYSHGMYRGMASHILAQGGEGIYLFNYFFGEYRSVYNGQLHLREGGYVCNRIMPELLQELGSLETLRKRNKIYFLDDGGSAAYGYKPETPLPLSISPEADSAANIFIGDNTKTDTPEEAVLFLRSDKPALFETFVNGVKVETQKPSYVSLFDRAQNLQNNEKVFALLLPAACLKQGDNKVRIHSLSKDTFTIKRLEIMLKFGDVKTHGYF